MLLLVLAKIKSKFPYLPLMLYWVEPTYKNLSNQVSNTNVLLNYFQPNNCILIGDIRASCSAAVTSLQSQNFNNSIANTIIDLRWLAITQKIIVSTLWSQEHENNKKKLEEPRKRGERETKKVGKVQRLRTENKLWERESKSGKGVTIKVSQRSGWVIDLPNTSILHLLSLTFFLFLLLF